MIVFVKKVSHGHCQTSLVEILDQRLVLLFLALAHNQNTARTLKAKAVGFFLQIASQYQP